MILTRLYVCVFYWFEQVFTGFHRVVFLPLEFLPPFGGLPITAILQTRLRATKGIPRKGV